MSGRIRAAVSSARGVLAAGLRLGRRGPRRGTAQRDGGATASGQDGVEGGDDAIPRALGSGDFASAIELLEGKGAYLDAARAALEMRDTGLAIRLLERVSVHDMTYGESCIALTKLYAESDEPELALRKIDDAATALGVGDLPVLREQVARLLEESGHPESALTVLETVRDRAHPDVAERIEKLRARLASNSVPSAATAAVVPTRTASLEERYELGVEIGRGKMGVVYKARDRYLDRVVALKCLPDEVKERPAAVEMFLAGARAAVALDHPNIVACFDVGQAGAVYYLTMEFLTGTPLDVVLRKRRSLPMDEKLRIAAQAAAGMAHAHSKGIVHCDIKPANLFYTSACQVKIMDFGLAKLVDEVRSDDSLICGSPSYMAPEQAQGNSFDHRADQYAFGVTLFEMMSGRLPFRSESLRDRQARPPDPREFAADIPHDLAKLILRLLSKDPSDRFDRTDQVSRELENLLAKA